MGHRALVAYERDRDRYDLHYSHWGAHRWHLATAITPEQPYGRPASEGSGKTTAVDPAPLATGCSFDEVLAEHLDFQQYEACYRVTESFAVEPWLVCWFGIPGVDGNRPGDGALLAVDPESVRTDGERLRAWYADVKETTCELVARERIDPATARSSLASAVQSVARPGRTVYFGPAAGTASE